MFGGLKRRVRDALIRRELRKVERTHMDKIRAVFQWLNAVPGRKRTIAAVAGALAVLLRGIPHICTWCATTANGVEIANTVVQGVTGTADLTTVVFAVWGIIDAGRKGRLLTPASPKPAESL
jgi:hypothetical protein